MNIYQNIKDFVASNPYFQLYKAKYIYSCISTRIKKKPKIKTKMKLETLILLVVNLAAIMERPMCTAARHLQRGRRSSSCKTQLGLALSPFYDQWFCLFASLVLLIFLSGTTEPMSLSMVLLWGLPQLLLLPFSHLLTGTRYIFQFS